MKPVAVLAPVKQKTDSHCGPAVVELLLSYWKIKATQDEIVQAAKVKGRIIKYGTRPDQLARAVSGLAPGYRFWFKQKADIRDLVALIKRYKVPVGINWQGLFYDTLKEESKAYRHENVDGDHGHYSVVTGIDRNSGKITITDTYCDYYHTPRVFSYDWFKTRWWDVDSKIDPKTGIRYRLETKRMIFIVAPKDAEYPLELGMKNAKYLPKFEPVMDKMNFSQLVRQLKKLTGMLIPG